MAIRSAAASSVYVVLMDGSVKYEHKMLADANFDVELSKRLILSLGTTDVPVFQLNQQIFEGNRSYIRGKNPASLIQSWPMPTSLSDSPIGWLALNKQRRVLANQNLIRGTLNATVATPKLPSVHLLNIPAPELPREMNRENILAYERQRDSQDLEEFYQAITKVLEEKGVRVVLLPAALTDFSQRSELRWKTGWAVLRSLDLNVSAIANQQVKNRRTALAKFVQNNPKTLFVMGAGQTGENLSDVITPGSLQFSNLLVVAALDRGGGILPASNYSADFVNVGALGTGASITYLDGTRAEQPGTGQAAARTVSILAQIFERSEPSLTPEGALKIFRQEYSFINFGLEGVICGGRYLDYELAMHELKLMREKQLSFYFESDGSLSTLASAGPFFRDNPSAWICADASHI